MSEDIMWNLLTRVTAQKKKYIKSTIKVFDSRKKKEIKC